MHKAWLKTAEEIEKSMKNTRANKACKVLKTMKAHQNKDHAGIHLIRMQEWVQHYQGGLLQSCVHCKSTGI